MINKMDKVLAQTLSSTTEPIECLVYVENIVTAEKNLNNANIKINGVYPFINALAISASTEQLSTILKLKYVKYMSSSTKVFAMMNVARKILGVDGKNLGKDITIAYVDTGISPHPDFTLGENRIIKFVDLINYRLFAYDDNGHGTFVSGVGSGSGLISNGKYAGVCPNSNIISIKALNEKGEANATKILEAMQWIFENRKKYNIKVVCMSFGSEPLGENDPIMKGAEALWDNGVVVVAAAGNSGPAYETIKSPGTSSKIITVGGFDDNRLSESLYNEAFFEIADFSSCGPALNQFKPDLVAPAVEINSCGLEKFYIKLSGTSVATPMIAGMCALYYAKNPNLKPSEIKKILLKSCSPITFNKNKEGAGRPIFLKSNI